MRIAQRQLDRYALRSRVLFAEMAILAACKSNFVGRYKDRARCSCTELVRSRFANPLNRLNAGFGAG